MSIALFAIIGATINAGPLYWVFYGMFCLSRLATIAFMGLLIGAAKSTKTKEEEKKNG